MFDNVIGLELTALKQDIQQKRLPPAILLGGARFNAKSTIALETARVLTCTRNADWECSCKSCSLHRVLQHPYTVMAGRRYFLMEIHAALHALAANPQKGAIYFLIRAIRKLTRRFDVFLWNDEILRKAEKHLSYLEEFLDCLGTEDTVFAHFPKEKVLYHCDMLRKTLPQDTVPVSLVRAVSSWARLTSIDAKVCIIEEAHLLHSSSCNAFLKILEDPPHGITFILTSSHTTAVLPTILSRVRIYSWAERAAEVQQTIIERVFRQKYTKGTLRDFLWSADFTKQKALQELCMEISRICRNANAMKSRTDASVDTAVTTHEKMAQVIIRIYEAVREPEDAEYFLEMLSNTFQHELVAGDTGEVSVMLPHLLQWNRLIKQAQMRIGQYHLNRGAVISDMVLAMCI